MKKFPLRYVLILIVAAILVVASLLVGFKVANNHNFVRKYNNGEYLTEKEEKLLTLNVPESYLPYYNLGNVAYENGDYNSAVGYYTKALSLYPVGQKDCMIRINLALAMCYSIDFANLDSQEKVDSALVILYKARDILLEKGCAIDVEYDEDGNVVGDDCGHNKDAQKLKDDIDKMIERLQNGSDSGDENDDQQDDQGNENQNQDGDEDNGGTSGDKEKKMQEKLEKNKKDALEERKETQDSYEKWYGKPGEGEDGGGSVVGEGEGSSGMQHPW